MGPQFRITGTRLRHNHNPEILFPPRQRPTRVVLLVRRRLCTVGAALIPRPRRIPSQRRRLGRTRAARRVLGAPWATGRWLFPANDSSARFAARISRVRTTENAITKLSTRRHRLRTSAYIAKRISVGMCSPFASVSHSQGGLFFFRADSLKRHIQNGCDEAPQ